MKVESSIAGPINKLMVMSLAKVHAPFWFFTQNAKRDFLVKVNHVLFVIGQNKILNSVIVFNPIQMMDVFMASKKPSNLFFHYQTMLQNSICVLISIWMGTICYPNITLFGIRFSIFVTGVFFWMKPDPKFPAFAAPSFRFVVNVCDRVSAIKAKGFCFYHSQRLLPC